MAKILVIDDCKEFRDAVGDVLSEEGYEVAYAESAEEGMALCEAQHFDLVLCDLALPLDMREVQDADESAMVGVNAIYRLSLKYPHLPIVAVSGQLTGDPLAAMRQFGACGSLSKPFQAGELLQTVRLGLAAQRG